MRETIQQAYRAYETGDRHAIEQALAEDLSFTSPYDDAIDRAGYFERCWPNHATTASMKVERIAIDGNAAYVTYLRTGLSGDASRNTEYLVFNGGRIAEIEVYFGADYLDGARVVQTPA